MLLAVVSSSSSARPDTPRALEKHTEPKSILCLAARCVSALCCACGVQSAAQPPLAPPCRVDVDQDHDPDGRTAGEWQLDADPAAGWLLVVILKRRV